MRLLSKLLGLSFLLLLPAFYTAAQEKAYPKNGEGMTLFLQRFNRNTPEYRKEFIRLNKGKFGKNYALLKGVKYTIPPLRKDEQPAKAPAKPAKKGSALYEPLFGKKYASFQRTSNELEGACYYLVSGHGGPDPGAIGRVGKRELHEDEYAYDIVLRIARNLMMRGAEVHIIIQDAKDGIRDQYYLNNSKRETCMGSPIPLNQVARLKQRCDKINALERKTKCKYRRALFVHIDSRSKSKRTDVYFYHSGSSKSKRLARTLKSTFQKKYDHHQPGRGFRGTVSKRNLYVLQNSAPPAVFVELANIQNTYDQQRIVESNNRQALANWIAEAFVKDYKSNK